MNCNNVKRENVEIVSTLDLHGFRLEKGISALTSFISESVQQFSRSRNGVWVRVITGTGQHSPNGPVLRTAVASTLNKRNMTFWMDPGKGSFTVRADSGFVLHFDNPATRENTKVVFRSRDENDDEIRMDLKIRSRTKIKPVEITSRPQNKEYLPLPCEVANEDKMISTVRNLSLKEAAELKSAEAKVSSELNMAMKQSLNIAARESELKYDEETMLEKAIALSKECNFNVSDDHDLEAAIKQSLALEESRKQPTCDDIDAAIRESLLYDQYCKEVEQKETQEAIFAVEYFIKH